MLAKLIFAQRDFNFDFGQQPDMAAEGLLAGMLVGMLIVLAIFLAITIVICYLVYSCFQRIPGQHRQMEPWQVWLCLIPYFGLVWNFFVYPKLAKSYQSYFAEQGRTDVGDCGEKIGLWFAISAAVAGVAGIIPCIGIIAVLIALPAALVLLIIFLVKALGLKRQIPEQTM